MTKVLVVVRHAKSSWEYGPISDLDRPLKEIGICNSGIVAARLKELNILPDLIVSSPAIRALHTSLITARELGYPCGRVQIDPGFYNESEEDILGLVKITDDSIQTLFIFGHNPASTLLPNLFLKKKIENLPTSGAVILEFNAEKWKDISKGNLKNEILIFPKELK